MTLHLHQVGGRKKRQATFYSIFYTRNMKALRDFTYVLESLTQSHTPEQLYILSKENPEIIYRSVTDSHTGWKPSSQI